ncbi:DUF2145 domain-containing protein [Acidovorax sp. Leaf160]|uniref:DUF2145 domain-containing protein n=1 Tax=Acidovorax sp. Leaf160 TaxID=1736280 RepID=UPI00070153A2|nr:DUF2145 domain-containing protein [Acidovorax sp. Leaf160]KQR37849.1 hypothetical protein ASF94_14125 [Acidovorax sp. Leaf160]
MQRLASPVACIARRSLPWLVAALTAAPALVGTAHAGRSCEQRQPSAQVIERGMQLAERTARALDAEFARSGTRVVVLARAGQDLSKYGLRWSHLGWAYRTPEGPWRVVHKLNACGTAVAHVYRQGLGDFFLDDLWRYEAAWAVPTPAVQQHVLTPLTDASRVKALHEPAYSMVSYAWGTRYQQSNQWALETLAAAMEPVTLRTRSQAQAWLQFKGYEPAAMKIGPLTRLGGRVTSANVAFDDHPNEKRFADRIETVTVDSVFTWLQRAQLAGAPVSLQAGP